MSLFQEFDHYNLPIGPEGNPYQYFEALRDEVLETDTPIGWSEVYGGFWVPAAYDAVYEIMQNPQAFSNREVTFPSYGNVEEGAERDYQLMLAGQDEPAHKKYRKLVNGPFSPMAAAKMAESLRATVNTLIDEFIERGRVDIIESFTNDVPARLTALILGLPPEDGQLYRSWTHAMSQGIHSDPEDAQKKLGEMHEYFVQLLADRRSKPGDDVLSGVVDAEVDGERLTDLEIEDFFVVLLLGGIDNTTKLLGSMFWRLAWDHELRRRLVDHPEMFPSAVDEFLRYYSPAYTCRLVVESVTIAGVAMEPGQHIVLGLPIANRDPRQFDHPDVFDPERSPNRHVALGMGIHRCLGAHLVRMEARVAAEEFVKRIPRWELDPERRSTWLCGQVSGMQEVSIVFPAGGGLPDPEWTLVGPPASAKTANAASAKTATTGAV
jgi:cytochrome P450